MHLNQQFLNYMHFECNRFNGYFNRYDILQQMQHYGIYMYNIYQNYYIEYSELYYNIYAI